MKKTLLQTLNSLPHYLYEDGKKFEFSLTKTTSNVWTITYYCPESESVRIILSGVDLHALAQRVKDHIDQFCKDLMGC